MDEKKAVTMEQLLESARKSEALTMQVARAAQAEMEKRPTSTEVNEAMDRLFTSVSDGKSLIASAITDKGVATAQDASFQTMRENILAIESGGGLPEGVYQISVSASTAEGGTVSGGGVASEGMTLTVSAAVADGYNFEGWQENGEVVSTDNPYTFIVTGDRTLTAAFAFTVTMYTVTATIDPAGAGTVTGAGQYQEGAQATITAIPADGYTFSGWTENGATVSASESYTFTVTGNRAFVAGFVEVHASRLPEGYTEVEYIESSGTQYINSGIIPNINTKIDMEFKITGDDGYRNYVLGYYRITGTSSNRKWYYLDISYYNGDLKLEISNGSQSTNPKLNGIISNEKNKLVFDYPNKIAYLNEEETVFSPPTSLTNMGYMYILSLNSVNGPTAHPLFAKLYSTKIYEVDTLKRDFVPCTNPSGEVGLYDLVTSSFYGNSGTGAFIAGPAV